MSNHPIIGRFKVFERAREYIRNSVLKQPVPESVYFYTFHKCASSLFSKFVLKNARGLTHVDYALQLYSGNKPAHEKLTFGNRGFIYGPIRISAGTTGPVGETLVKPTIDHEFVRDKIALFLVRDPRDILVSSYYSFGFTHGLSPVIEIREEQEAFRRRIRDMTLDEYVLEHVEPQIHYFNTLHGISRACKRGAVLKYEDMVEEFDRFAAQLLEYIDLDESVISQIHAETRPRGTEDTTSPRRSGRVGGFREKLGNRTIEILNEKLADTLARFGYRA